MKPKGISFGSPLILKVPGQPDQPAIVSGITKRGFIVHMTDGDSHPNAKPPKQLDKSKASAEVWLKGQE